MSDEKEGGYRKKSAARLAAVQVLYTKKILGVSEAEAVKNFQDHYMGKNLEESPSIKPDISFLKTIVSGVCSRESQLLDLIKANLSDTWTVERLDPILLNILECGVLELLVFPDVDAPIIISEYLDVTHAFFDKKEVGFVNGILNKIRSTVRPS